MHGIWIRLLHHAEFVIRFVKDNENALGNALVELFKRLAREESARGIVGIGQINELGFWVNGIG